MILTKKKQWKQTKTTHSSYYSHAPAHGLKSSRPCGERMPSWGRMWWMWNIIFFPLQVISSTHTTNGKTPANTQPLTDTHTYTKYKHHSRNYKKILTVVRRTVRGQHESILPFEILVREKKSVKFADIYIWKHSSPLSAWNRKVFPWVTFL